MEDTISKINQLLAGITCEVNRQARVYVELETVNLGAPYRYVKAYPEYLDNLYKELEILHERVCDFSNARDINDNININFNNCIIDNLKIKTEE